MPSFQEGQPDCFYVCDFGLGWNALSYTPYLRVWSSGSASENDYQMVAYTGSPSNANYAQVASSTAFPNGDGKYKAQGLLKSGSTIKLSTPVVDVVVKKNLPSPA